MRLAFLNLRSSSLVEGALFMLTAVGMMVRSVLKLNSCSRVEGSGVEGSGGARDPREVNW